MLPPFCSQQVKFVCTEKPMICMLPENHTNLRRKKQLNWDKNKSLVAETWSLLFFFLKPALRLSLCLWACMYKIQNVPLLVLLSSFIFSLYKPDEREDKWCRVKKKQYRVIVIYSFFYAHKRLSLVKKWIDAQWTDLISHDVQSAHTKIEEIIWRDKWEKKIRWLLSSPRRQP